MRRLGVIGGTFDPIHLGHLFCAEEARERFELERVMFIPAGEPWQKSDVSPAEDRYLMTVLATRDNPDFCVSRIEIDRGGPTFTLDTLQALRDFYPSDCEIFFVSGADAVLDLLTWKNPEQLLELATFVAASRPGFDLSKLRQADYGDRVLIMEMPELEISSSYIRSRLAEGTSIRYLVPPEVEEYIRGSALYK